MNKFKLYTTALLVALFTCVGANNVSAINTSTQTISETVSITNGLSNNGVTAMFYDSKGYLWIATYDGLNRYNGHAVTTYKNTSKLSLLPTNRVRAINEDRSGHLWIGTDKGVAVYDYHNDSFIQIENSNKEGIIREIAVVNDYVYCISEDATISIYDMQLNLIGRDIFRKGVTFFDYTQQNQSLYIATSIGIVEYKVKQREFKTHLKGEILAIESIDSHTMIVGGSDGADIIEITPTTLKHVKTIIPSTIVRKIMTDKRGKVWIGTEFDGVFYISNIDAPSDKTNAYLTNMRISNFEESPNGDIWVSTFDNGIFRLSINEQLFHSLPHNYSLKMPLNVYQYDEERLLLKSRKQIHIYNTSTNSYESIPAKLQTLSQYDRQAMCIGNNGLSWWLSPNGCYKYDIKSDNIERLDDPKLLVLNDCVPSYAVKDMNGNIWLGAFDNLFRISIDNNDSFRKLESIHRNKYFSEYRINGRVRKIYPDASTNSIWVGTDFDGLYVIKLDGTKSLREAKVSNYKHNIAEKNSLSSNFVSSILRDKDGVMWVGTEQGGLCRVNEDGATLTFDNYTEDDGLSNNTIKALECDSQGRLWIATNVGLNSFDVEKNHFRVYRKTDGLPFEEFLYSSVMWHNGALFFTGAHDICYFDPSRISNYEKLPTLHFNSLNIYDKVVKPNEKFDNRVILKSQLRSGDSFTLDHDQNTFTVRVDVLYDQNTSYHHYHYMLEPANNKWITSYVADNKMTFNGLNSGRYTLRVKASNASGDMSPESVLHITVKRPLYGSIVAYVIYLAMLISIIIIVGYFVMRNKTLQYHLTLEAQEKSILKQTNIEKQRYFSNISHELKTPLTLITAPLSILSERFRLDVNIRVNLEIMQRQTRKMLQLIDLAHGIQLSDENLLELKPTLFVVRDLLKDIASDFEFLANFDKKVFSVEYPNSILRVNADRSMIEKVLNNLLNNAFKYTSNGDDIAVNYYASGSNLTLVVRDSGSGVATSDLPYIFDRFYTSEQIETKRVGGTGIGLAFSKYLVELHGGTIKVESEYGEGTTFTIELPIIVEEVDIPQIVESQEEQSECSLIISSSEEIDENIVVEYTLRDKMVYVVEDNGEMRAFITDIVSRYFKVTAFASARECLTAMEGEWPDIIVSDVMMPDMDGDKMCEIIKSDLNTSHIPIILLTARYTVDDKIKGIELGADSYIGKPFYPKHLITRLSSLLRGRQKLYDHFHKGLPFKKGNSGGMSSHDAALLSSLYALFDSCLDNDEVELDSFAVELGLNRTFFYSKIKALTDLSPYELLKNYRLQRANELLRSGEYNVNEVYEMTGFKSRTHFSRVFKQCFGVSPSKVEQQ